MKRRIVGLLLALIVVAGIAAPPAAHAQTFDRGMITGEDVAFRRGGSVDSALIRRLDRGTVVEILETNVNAEWHKVRVNGTTGYVNRMYVSLDLSLPAYQRDYTGEVVNCNEFVNVRAGASASSRLLGTAQKGSEFEVTSANVADGWHQIDYDGRTAYIAAKYLELTAKASNTQLRSLTVTGGTMTPAFSPEEYGYVVRTDRDEVTIEAAANPGVKVDIGGTGRSSYTLSMPASGSKTIRIAVGGKTRYTVYVVRGALVVGSWNIKRGNGQLELQGRLVETQQLDILALQEVYRNGGTTDNLASLRTKDMQHMRFAQAIGYSGGGQYGVGLLSRYEMEEPSTVKLESGSYEQRVLQRAVVTVDGKQVSLYNTHLSYNSTALRRKQFAQILEALESDPNPYRILFGDFNAAASEFAQLRGYTVVNTADTLFYNYAGALLAKNEIDNIVVSDNITVLNARMVETGSSDHRPLIAYLVLR